MCASIWTHCIYVAWPILKKPPWYFWLIFGLVYGAIFGYNVHLFVGLWRQNKERERDNERREWNRRPSVDIDQRGWGRNDDPLSLVFREAHEWGRWEGTVLARIDEHSSKLRTLANRIEHIESRLDQSGSPGPAS